MQKLASFICGTLVVIVPSTFAQGQPQLEKVKKIQVEKKSTPAPGPKRASLIDKAEVRRLVKDLSSRVEAVRREAAIMLETLGSSALPALRESLQGIKDVRAKEMLQEIIEKMKPVPAVGLDQLRKMKSRLDRMVEEFEKEFGALPGGRFRRGQRFGWFSSPGAQKSPSKVPFLSEQSGINIKVTPDGVQVEIKTKDSQGKETVKLYKAKNLSEFQRLYPEAAKKIQLKQWFPFGKPPSMQKAPNFARPFGLRPGTGSPQAIPSKYQLGVYIKDVPPAVADYLGLQPGMGLLIDGILPGSLAARLGIRANDLLVTVNGTSVRGVASVAVGLRETPPNGLVRVVVLRKGLKVTMTTKQKVAPKAQIKQLKKI